MNLKEAYSILEIPQTSTPEEAKKKYRELTKKFHPDVNKEPGAEDKFKKINEAYQIVSTGKGTDLNNAHWGSAQRDPFSGWQRHDQINHIEISTTISFKESVQGCKKDIKFDRNIKCTNCGGQGETPLDNGCDKCGGKGQVTGRRGNMVFIQTCDKCMGKVKTASCNACSSSGTVSAEVSFNVTIPGGLQDGNILRLAGMGHFAGFFGPLEQHTDVHLHVRVTPEPGLWLDGSNVVSNLEISLLDALRGCKKTVKTVSGNKEIDVKPKSKNKDEVIIPRMGVNNIGNQRVILDIKYPEDINSLIDYLTEKPKPPIEVNVRIK